MKKLDTNLIQAFDQATTAPEQIQEKLLLEILKHNQATEYGKEHLFSTIRNSDDFQQTVPVQTYNDISSYIEKMKLGGQNILTADLPCMFSTTSGTTDKPKYIPLTQKNISATSDLFRQWFTRPLREHPGFLNHSILCISGAVNEGKTASGIPCGSASGVIYKNLPKEMHSKFALPFAVSEISDYSLRYYLIARFALEKKISFIATPNPMTLTKVAEIGIKHQKEIIKSIRDGSIVFNGKDETTRLASISKSLKPNPERADFLENILQKHGRLSLSACWPELKLIGCWLGGSIGLYKDRLSQYFDKDIPLRDLGYLASEGAMSIPYRDSTPKGILAIQNNYYEFISEDENPQMGKLLKSHQLKQGKRYKIIITNWNGLYRYDIQDIIEVCGFYNQTPIIKFIRKSEEMISMMGEKLHENHFIALSQALKQEFKLTNILLKTIPNHNTLRHEILIHMAPKLPLEVLKEQLLPLIDSYLMKINIEYQAKRKSKRLNPPKMHIMNASWEEESQKDFRKQNNNDSQFKWRIIGKEFSKTDLSNIERTLEQWGTKEGTK